MSHKEFSRESVREFIESNMNVFDEDVELNDDTNIFASGYVNSIFAMRLLNFLETEYDLEVPDDDIVMSNFSSIEAMHSLVSKLQEA
ncbi:acyl carrier protein [Alteromonas sp. a30]|uniref:acyl carrier protein n=1 Tax=Alteromonas sp. a30 TaxID=2730917 RepID=UPI00227E65E3|nr:acyl carrier protein [Alteromonas sp. a30]MCY7295206.1 acyl carrier protein [Alteromonas sp. a30]